MKKNSKIYVAGHTGLVGSAIMRELQTKGFSNIVVKSYPEFDLTRQDQVDAFFEKENPEYVFLAAAKVGGIIANSTYMADFIYQNLMIAANIINAAYKYRVKKLLNLGSSCIYPRLAPQPIKEEYVLTGLLEPTNEAYAIAKIAAIKLCRYFNEQYGTNFISLMPCNMYGPNDNFNLETSHVLPAMIRKMYLAKLLENDRMDLIKEDFKRYPLGFGLDKKVDFEDDGSILDGLNFFGIKKGQLALWGSGEPFREFLYVDDLADACLFFMSNHSYKEMGELVNIGLGKDLKIFEIASLVKDIVGFKGQIVWDRTKPDGMPKKLLDVSRAKTLGWQPKVDLKEGLKKVFNWYESLA